MGGGLASQVLCGARLVSRRQGRGAWEGHAIIAYDTRVLVAAPPSPRLAAENRPTLLAIDASQAPHLYLPYVAQELVGRQDHPCPLVQASCFADCPRQLPIMTHGIDSLTPPPA